MINLKFKKANVIDLFVIAAFVFAFGITILLGKVIMGEFADELGEGSNSSIMSNKSQEFITRGDNTYVPVFTANFIFIWVGLFIATIISAFFIRSHPAFFVIAIIILGIYTWLNAVFSDVFTQLSSVSNVATTADQFSVVTFVMENFPFFMIIFGIIVAIVLYSKLSVEDV